MSKELELSLLSKVRAFLGVEDSSSPAQLFSLLRDYRNQFHPDRFQDDERRKLAEAKFKEAQGLMSALTQFIQDRALSSTPTELALYEPQINHIFLMREVDSLKSEITDLKNELENKNSINENLNYELEQEKDKTSKLEKQLNDRLQEHLKAEAQEIETLYKPTLQTFASTGIIVLITTVVGILYKMEEVATFLQKYSPVEGPYIKSSLFLLSALLISYTAKRLFENHLLRNRAREISSPHFCKQFIAHLGTLRSIHPDKVNSFTEDEAFQFIRGKERWWEKTLAVLGFGIFQVETVNRLTDYLLATLLAKKLIVVADAELLDRSFIIKSRGTRYLH